MLKILLLEDNKELLDKLSFVLEGVSETTVISASNFSQAEKILSEELNIGLLVVDYRSGTAPEVKRVQEAAVFIDCIMCVDDINNSSSSAGWKIIERVDRKSIATNLKQIVEKIYAGKDSSSIVSHFCRIKTSILLETSPLHADIYAKLSDTKFIKIFHKGALFELEDFKKYAEQKKLEYLYLHEDQCDDFIHKYVTQIDSLISKHQPLPEENLAMMNMVAYDSVHELTHTLGFNKEVQQLAKAHVQLAVEFMDKKPNLNRLLNRLKFQTGKYMADHSYLTSYIACGIATHLQWGSDATFFKLTLASFLHDLALTDDRLGSCTSIEQAVALGMSDKEVNLYKNHPAIASSFVRRMTEIPADVDIIIQQHHELPDGKGFPRGLTAPNISPLSAVFIVAHDIVSHIFFPPAEGFHFKKYLDEVQDRYQHSSFRRVLEAAKKLDLPP